MPTQDDQRFTPALSVERQSSMPVWCATAGALLIAGLVLLVYLPCLGGGFILDDNLFLTGNNLIPSSDGLYRIWFTTQPFEYYPISYSSLWLEWRLWGRNPTGYRVTNLMLHIAAALLIWVILRKLSISGAFLAALMFAVHPVNVESVGWIAQRRNVLAMVFFLSSILCYLCALKQRTADNGLRTSLWYWLSLFAFVLAMLSKGSVAVLPVLLLLIVWWLRERVSASDWLRTAPFFLLALALTCLNVWFQTHGREVVFNRDAGFAERLAGAGAVVWFYLSKALAPIDLIFFYPQWHIQMGRLLWWLPILAVAALSAALWWQRHSPQANWGRPLLFAWAFFCVALMPVLGFIDVGVMQYSLVADRYQHVAIIGVLALVAAGWSVWHNRTQGAIRWVATTTAVVSVGALMLLTWQQNRLYGNPINLYQATLQENPESWIVHSELGNVLMLAGRLPEAIQHEQQALRLNPGHAETHNNLGVALYKQGNFPEAIAQYQEAIELIPNYAEAHYNLSDALFKTNRPQEALEQCELALQFKPDYFEARLNLGVILAKLGRLQEAIDQFQQSLLVKPDCLDAYANLATAYAQLQQPAKAIDAAQKALSLAQSEGKTDLARSIKDWLTKHRSEQPNSKNASP